MTIRAKFPRNENEENDLDIVCNRCDHGMWIPHKNWLTEISLVCPSCKADLNDPKNYTIQ